MKYILLTLYGEGSHPECNFNEVNSISKNVRKLVVNNEAIARQQIFKFSRINRSAIISKDHIRELVSKGMRDFSFIMNDGSSFTVTKHYKSSFLEKMGIR
ncbi:MAG: LytTR family transcriptional regulator DNA-binding domain-containing protein [Bacteroidota bacterium]